MLSFPKFLSQPADQQEETGLAWTGGPFLAMDPHDRGSRVAYPARWARIAAAVTCGS